MFIYKKGNKAAYAPVNAFIVFNGTFKSKPHIIVNKKEYKHCSKCGSWRLLNKFHVSNKKLDGLQGYCKQCGSDIRNSKLKKKIKWR